MAKKSKLPPPATPDSSTVFSKLFGNAPDTETPSLASIFSAENPFRRKQAASDGPITSPVTKEKKKKKKKGKKKVIDGGRNSENESEGKKSKKESELDGETKIKEEDVKTEKNKKKRKRDELERECAEVVIGNGEEEELSLVGQKRKTVENAAAMKVSKERYDDEDKLLRTVFVGNLPVKVKKKALLKEFSQFGEVESVRLRSIPTLDGKKPKKVMIRKNKINEDADSIHAYIVFKTEQSAEASIAHNMAVVCGNHIRVDRACPPRKKLKGDSNINSLYDSKRTIFLGNLPFDVKDEELYQLFTSMNQVGSSVEAIRVIRDSQTSLGKGIAYVLLKTREAANSLAKRRNVKLRDRELRISHAKSSSSSSSSSIPNSTPTKRNAPSVDGSEKTPGKKIAYESKTPISGHSRPRMSASASYEGVRATKSGEKNNNKPYRKVMPHPVAVFKSGSNGKDEIKQRAHKRPAVAARRAKEDAQKAGGSGSNQAAGKKRKIGSRTPQSSYKKTKKAKRSS